MSEYGEVFIIGEHFDGEIQNVTFELLGEGRKLADKLGTTLSVALLGYKFTDQAQKLIARGADKVYIADHAELAVYRTLPYRRVIIDLMASMPKTPHIMLQGGTTTGRDLAPRIAAHFTVGLTADCTELDVGDYDHKAASDPTKVGHFANCLYAIRPTFGESLKARILGPWKNPQCATARPGVMNAMAADNGRKGEVVMLPVNFLDGDMRLSVLETFREISKSANLAEADVIISGGYGMGNAQGFEMLKELAACFKNSVVGASRKAVDAKWISYPHQVGQTGKTVKPKLYIACGISGAIQHRVGMQHADIIFAINKDPDAPIFRFAHHGIVGDLYQIVPELITTLKSKEGSRVAV